MKKGSKDKHFIKRPIFDGGPAAMKKFLKENLTYPKKALKNKIEGTVHIKYVVDNRGKVIEVKNISSLGHGCDEEAIRLVKMLKFLVPHNPRKLRIKFNQKIQIHFKLPKKKPASKSKGKAQTQLNITYTTDPSKTKKSNKEIADQGYSYTISW